MKIDPQYQKLILQIKKDGEKYADQQMNTVYAAQRQNRDELHKYLGLLYVHNAVGGLLNVTPAQKNTILSEVNNQIIAAEKNVGQTEVKAVTGILKHNYGDMYYKTAYVMDSGLKAGIKFGLLKPEYLNAAVNSPVDGEIFSDRIWNNKAAVANRLKQSFVGALNGNTTIDKIGQEISQIFNAQAYDSMRLVNTENARMQSAAIDDIGKSAGCSQQMFCATLEDNTCEECAGYDGKYFDIDDDSKPDIPVHPECRCCYINVPPIPGWAPLKRRDNETGEDIEYEDYAQWAADKGIKNNGENDSFDGESGIIDTEDSIRKDIKNGNYPLQINLQAQNKHIPGTNEYVEGKSYLTVSAEETQSLVNQFAGTGTPIIVDGEWKNKERITSNDNNIGVYRDIKGNSSETSNFIIHYNHSNRKQKRGTHIVPSKP